MKKFSPSSERNKKPILDVLVKYFPRDCRVLEVASGTGQHADYFTSMQPGWAWQTTDLDDEGLDSISEYRNEAKRPNFLAPVKLSTLDEEWELGKYDAALCCNMIHISPWKSCWGLFRHLQRHLNPESYLALYGPFFTDEVVAAPSNLEFDQLLKMRDPSFGIRHLNDVMKVAIAHGFELEAVHEMPANNLTVFFRLA